MPSKEDTTLAKPVENTVTAQKTASGNRIQPWKAFLTPLSDGTALADHGADDMVYQLKNGVQDNGIAS